MGHTKRSHRSNKEALNITGLPAPVEVRRHPTARRMTLRVSRTRRAVIMTVPLRCNLADAGTFVTTHIDWVRQHLGTVPQPVPFADGVLMPFRGDVHQLKFIDARDEDHLVRVVEPGDGEMPELVVAGARNAPRLLHNWLIEAARTDLDACVVRHARRLGARPKRIAIRDQASRWGSCSTTRVLSFSWRLVLAPPFVLDYVAAHEVAHLLEMNHGPRFWSLVDETMPQVEEAKVWLRHYGMDLHRYGQQG